MRIGLTTSVIQRGHGGVGQYVLALVRALAGDTRGHEFTLFVLENDLPLFDFASRVMRLEPVSEKMRHPIRDILWHQTALPRRAHQLGLDVLHVPSYRRLLAASPCARVATIHDLAPFHVSGKYDPLRMFYGRTVVRRLAALQDEIIAVSHATAEDLSRFFHLRPDKVSVVHNGLDHARFNPGDPSKARGEAARIIGCEKPFFLYTARLEHPGKNHMRLIEAYNHFRTQSGIDWALVLAGRDWQGAEVIHEAARRSAFGSDIHFLGFVSDADMPMWYRAAAVFVYPSLYEGFGLPPLEAMACGCPVVASTVGALPEVCGDAAEPVDPEDLFHIVRALGRVASDQCLRERLRLAGLERARSFDWRNTAEATMEVYARAVARAAATGPDARGGVEPKPISPPTGDRAPT